MEQNFAQMFWQHVLTNLKMHDTTPISDPVKRLREMIDQGLFRGTPTWQVDSIIKSIAALEPMWQNADTVPAVSILLNLLQNNEASGAEISRLATCLADISKTYKPYKSDPMGYDPSDDPDLPFPDVADMNDIADDDHTAKPVQIVWTPKMIYNMLDRHIHGQENAKRAASLVTFNMLRGRRSNVLFCGPSGCGKSEIWRRLQRAFPSQVRIVDAARLSADGWKGSVHIRDFFNGLSSEDIARNGLIVVMDESDKIFSEPMYGSHGTDYSAITQNSLLRMLDGDRLEFGIDDGDKSRMTVDCSNVSVVMLGAFERLFANKNKNNKACMGFGADHSKDELTYDNSTVTYEDLIGSGMRREIAGRINRIVRLRPLAVSDYETILTDHVLTDLEADLCCKIKVPETTVNELAQQAYAEKLGVRWMKSQVMSAIDDIMFEHPNTQEYRIDTLPTREEGEMQ